MNQQVIEGAKPLGISVHDHIIIGRLEGQARNGLPQSK
jgi:DNA repair protein RadC